MSNKEFEIVGSSESDIAMRKNLGLFSGNITFNEKYIKCVKEIISNKKRIHLFNLLKEIRNSKK